MKRGFLLFVLTLFNFLAFGSHYVVISGYVTDTNGHAVAQLQVHAYAQDSFATTSFSTHTNANGYYIDTLFFNANNLGYGDVWITDCMGDSLIHSTQWGASTSASVDFTYCEQSGNSNQCNASFTFQHGTGDSIFFLNQSLGQNLNFAWSFGDGDSAFTENPVHAYDSAGNYQVCLNISSPSGCTDHYCLWVQVSNTNNCEANFSYQTDSLGLAVYFQNHSQGDSLTYSWSFGNGAASSQENPVFTFNSYGHHVVCLTISNANCSDTYCDTLDLQPTCHAGFGYNIHGDTVHFNNTSYGSQLSYFWTFGDGTTSSATNPVHSYDSAGVYPVCLTTSSPNGCSDTFCSTVQIAGTSTCDANFSFQRNDSLVSFFDNSTGSNLNYHWDFGDSSYSSLKNPTHIYTDPGNYVVCLEVTDNHGCSDIQCITIYVGFQNCDASFNYQVSGSAVSFQNTSQGTYNMVSWFFGDGSGSNVSNPTHTYQGSGTYQVCLTVEDSNTACVDTFCDSVVIQASGQNYTISGQIFAGNNLVTNGSAILYQDSSGILIALDTTQVDSLLYTFDNLPADTYYVVGRPDSGSPYFNNYMPTYVDSALHWQNATPLVVGPSIFNAHVYLQEQTSQQNGNGFISGTVSEGTGKTWGGGARIQGAIVFLRDQSDDPVQFDITDHDGKFEFTNVEMGQYSLYAEIANYTCEPFIVTVNEERDTIGGINFQASDGQIITGLLPPNAPKPISFSISPNPFQGNLQVELDGEFNSEVIIRMINLNGEIVKTKTISNTGSTRVRTENLPAGMYLIEVISEKGQSNIKAIKMK